MSDTPCASSTHRDQEETLWDTIVGQVNEEHAILSEPTLEKEDRKSFVSMFRRNPALCYLKQNIYPVLLPVLKHTFHQVLLEGVLSDSRTKFHPLDHVAYLLWNMNPHPPEQQPSTDHRLSQKTLLYDIPFVHGMFSLPRRPYYSSSWLWSLEKAAEVIQKCVRGMAVRRQNEVKELRQFWKMLEMKEEKMKRCAVLEEEDD
ncbi:hypothetical protein WDU94_006056 [Cyamophila willieti]